MKTRSLPRRKPLLLPVLWSVALTKETVRRVSVSRPCYFLHQRCLEVCVGMIVAFTMHSRHLSAEGSDWMGTARGVAGILFDVAEGAAEALDPLKAVLGDMSTIYTNYEVSLRLPAQNSSLRNASTGNCSRQKQGQSPLPSHSCAGGNFRSTCG